MVQQKQQIVHQQPPGPAIAVGKGMDILEFGVKIGRRRQGLFRTDILQFAGQLTQLLRYILGERADLLDSGYIVVFLIDAGPLALLVAQSVIGSLGEKPLKLTDQSLTQGLPLLKGVQHPVIGRNRVLNLKQGAHIPGVARHAPVVEDLPGIVVGDPVVFNLGGVVNKRHTVPVHLTGNIGGGFDLFALPDGDNILIIHPKSPR